MTTAEAVLIALGCAALFFLAVAAAVYRAGRGWKYVSFSPHKFSHDPDSDEYTIEAEQIDFLPRLQTYSKIAEVVIALASASIIVLPKLRPAADAALVAFSAILLGICVALSIFFMVLLTYFYEESLYFPRSYTVARSALVNAVGFTALFCFALAYLGLAGEVALYAKGSSAHSVQMLSSGAVVTKQGLDAGKAPDERVSAMLQFSYYDLARTREFRKSTTAGRVALLRLLDPSFARRSSEDRQKIVERLAQEGADAPEFNLPNGPACALAELEFRDLGGRLLEPCSYEIKADDCHVDGPVPTLPAGYVLDSDKQRCLKIVTK